MPSQRLNQFSLPSIRRSTLAMFVAHARGSVCRYMCCCSSWGVGFDTQVTCLPTYVLVSKIKGGNHAITICRLSHCATCRPLWNHVACRLVRLTTGLRSGLGLGPGSCGLPPAAGTRVSSSMYLEFSTYRRGNSFNFWGGGYSVSHL